MARITRYLLFCICMFSALILSAEESNEKWHVISAVAPVFPFDCYLTKTSGKIKVKLTVNNAGDVTNAFILETSAPFLVEDSIKAARQWKFSDGSGTSTSNNFVVTFYFRIMPDNTPKEELTVIYRLPLEMEIRGKGKPSFREEMPSANHD